ncbi:MAG: hypothetical protein L6416_06315 [Candidatus Omnitrophica bacterium]|nr:hypothetical protein [Candidatus Omnitrophota bacterium]
MAKDIFIYRIINMFLKLIIVMGIIACSYVIANMYYGGGVLESKENTKYFSNKFENDKEYMLFNHGRVSYLTKSQYDILVRWENGSNILGIFINILGVTSLFLLLFAVKFKISDFKKSINLIARDLKKDRTFVVLVTIFLLEIFFSPIVIFIWRR